MLMLADESGGHTYDIHCTSRPNPLLLATPSASKIHVEMTLTPRPGMKHGDHTPPDDFPEHLLTFS
jgi:hypothetical protein